MINPIKTADLLRLCGTLQGVGDLFDPPLTRSAIGQWGVHIPPLRAYELRELYPDIDVRIAAVKARLRQ